MKQFNYLIMICILSMLNPFESSAQGLSLSFNLSETDTLANMIAESKKYNITSLTLSGYVNDVNVKYIQDLNQNGKLKKLDLSRLSYISANGQSRIVAQKNFESYRIDSKFVGLIDFLKEYGYPDVESIDLDILHRCFGGGTVTVTVEDIIYEQSVLRTFSGMKHDGYGTKYDVDYNATINEKFCSLMPKRIFDICSFDTFITPENLEILGGNDCTYRIKSCNEYVLGHKVHGIGDNAFLGSHIGNLVFYSPIESIGEHAFENTSGNISLNILSNASIINDCAFKNSTCFEKGSNELLLKADTIGYSAFQNALLPTNIVLQNVEEIRDSAFMGASIKGIEIGNNCKVLPDSAFANCADLEYVKGCQSVESIGNYAFGGCKMLKDYSPSNSLQSLGCYAFANDSVLSSFVAPNSLTTIGEYAFYNSGVKKLVLGKLPFRKDIIKACSSLEAIEVSNLNESFQSKDGVIFSKDGKNLLFYPYGKMPSIYEIPNSVIEISDSAFFEVNKLGALVIPESIKTIGKNAFGNSSILELKVMPSTTPKVTDNNSGLDQSLVRLFVHEKDYSTYYIANYWGDFKNIFVVEHEVSPDGLIHIEEAGTLPRYVGFGNPFNYKSLRLSGKLNGDDIRYLREMAGRDINGEETSGVLKELDFSQASIVKGGGCYYGGLTTSDNILGESMFEGCRFTSLEISNSTTKIDRNALFGCPLESFKLPAATKELSLYSFLGMQSLKEFTVDPDNQKYMSLNGVLFTKDGRTLLLYPYSKQGESYSVPEATTSIGEEAFGGFYLKTVITNEGLERIGTMAFDNLRSLEAISLASTLKTIGRRAFWSCNNLLTITCKAYYSPTLEPDDKVFSRDYHNFSDRTYETANLLVPEKNAGYKSRSGWELFNNIIETDDWINGVQPINDNDNAKIEKRYDLNGRLVTSPYHGVYIIKMSNGTSKKIFMR